LTSPTAQGAASAAPAWGLARSLANRTTRSLLSVALTFLGLTCVTFFIGRVIPIDPVLAIVGDKASAETYARVRAEIGLDLPIPVQYWRYLVKVVHGDFGNSVITSRPVLHDLLQVFPATLELALLALLIGVVAGVPMGVLAATHRGRWQDQVIRFLSLLGYSMPVFWLGLIGLLLFYARLGWVEGPRRLHARSTGKESPVTTRCWLFALCPNGRRSSTPAPLCKVSTSPCPLRPPMKTAVRSLTSLSSTGHSPLTR